ncbi:hypothetical protein Patl1_14029 [Pistacia atlantica]|uniref:Uncharacterized protein n=1 Tax=Pistacia atlantica TaxID=434234 RepID=A0ACC1AUA1_9ROSI|nr:hypothetical protein Patl1_14029 [Pistacia atlantica]
MVTLIFLPNIIAFLGITSQLAGWMQNLISHTYPFRSNLFSVPQVLVINISHLIYYPLPFCQAPLNTSTFNDLDHHQVAALASCFIPVDKSSEQINLRTELAKPLQQLQESARKIAEIQHECKLEVNVDEYVESTVRPFLMDVIYCWSKGASFAEVIQMTDIFEGSIIRSARRLDEFLNQLRAAAQAVGEVTLENKFAAASGSLRRGIMFANSLYL